MSDQNSSKELAARLSQYTTCDVSDALVKLNLPRGGFLPGLAMWSPYTPHHLEAEGQATRIVGEAFTVLYAPADDPRSEVAIHYIDYVPPGAILFISSPTPVGHTDIEHSNAVYGGLMSTCAQARGAAGTIVDGRIRDINEHRALNYPVFSRGIGTAPPAPLLKVISINDPDMPMDYPCRPPSADTNLARESIQIHPGDFLMGDLNGVVCIPRQYVESVLSLIPAQVEADERIAKAMTEQGITFVKARRMFRGK